jgi:hypothetical protein
MKRIFMIVAAALLTPLMGVQAVGASSVYRTGATGVDVSYPNCGLAIPKVEFGIVGVTGGLVFSKNPCLASQASKFTNLSLYINTGLNATSSSPYFTEALARCEGDRSCAAYAYGKNAANDAIAYAQSQGVSSDKWWLDVETENTWNNDVMLNRQSLQGAYDALKAHGAATIGAYSTTYQWNEITGGWKNGWPNWGATTWTTAKQAAKYCTGHEFTGGPSLLMQFKSKASKLDQDVAC